jgi:hypothetical protein
MYKAYLRNIIGCLSAVQQPPGQEQQQEQQEQAMVRLVNAVAETIAFLEHAAVMKPENASRLLNTNFESMAPVEGGVPRADCLLLIAAHAACLWFTVPQICRPLPGPLMPAACGWLERGAS